MLSLHHPDADPQKSVPCITAIGFNGVLLWQNGMVSLSTLLRETLRATHKSTLTILFFILPV